jgi:broad specificity phosphatase PhoE
MPPNVVLARHGATEWSRDGRHTGRTDIPLTDDGRREAELLRRPLSGRRVAAVMSSPLARALDTARLAGFADGVELRDELMEWDYGDYEGISTPDIRRERPDWYLWRDGCPGGETAADVGARVDRVIADLVALDGDAAVFAHGHVLRVLAARWVELAPEAGALIALSTGTLSELGWERETRVIRLWNARVAALAD